MDGNGCAPRRADGWASLVAAIVVLCAVLWASPARAAEVQSYRVAAALSRDGSSVRGLVRAHVAVAAGEREIALWLFADRLAVAPVTDEISFRWVWPGEIDRGGPRIEAVRVDGVAVTTRPAGTPRGASRAQAGRDLLVTLPGADQRARRVDLEVAFELQLPARYGRLGHAEADVVVLGSPWYPLVLPRPGAREPIATVEHAVALSAFPGWTIVGPSGVGVSGLRVEAPFVPFVALRDPVIRSGAGGRATWIGTSRPYRTPPSPRRAPHDGADALTPTGLPDPFGLDQAASTLEAATQALDTLRWLHVPTGREHLLLVEVPLRAELVAAVPGMVLVSDAAFDLFPLEALREFHARAVRQGVLRWGADGPAARLDPPALRGIGAEVRAAALVDLDYARRAAHAQTVEDLVGFAAFHPTIDQLLYAPQVQFPDVYFGSAGVHDPFRDDPDRARDGAPPGRYVLERLRDVLSDEAFLRARRRLAGGRSSFEDVVRAAGGADAVATLRRVVAHVPRVNYRLGAVRSERVGDHYRHTVEVLRDGDRDTVEPVEVEVEDERGHRVSGVWNGPGPRGVVVVESGARLEDATIDPRGRLAQDADVAGDHPRYDDATSWPFRPPVFQSFQLALSPGDLGFEALLDVVVRRRYELGQSFGGLAVVGSGGAAVALRHVWSFGATADLNRMRGYFGLALDGARTFGGYSASSEESWVAGASVLAGWDTRRYYFDMREGWSVLGAVRVALAFDDDGDRRPLASASVRASRVIPLSLRNVVIVLAGAGLSLGDGGGTDLAGISGRRALRGYENSELLGEVAGFALAEYRYTLVQGLAINVAHLAWIRAVQLAAFFGAGLVAGERSDRSTDGPLALDAGGGLRIHFDYGGVQPGVLAIDVGYPISRVDDCELGSDGGCARRRLPVGIWFAFDQIY